MLTVGQMIKFGRINHDMSQDDLAKRLNVSKNYVSLVENDRKDPSIGFLKNAARLLNIPLILLIWEKMDLPAGKTKKEKEIREQIDRMIGEAHRMFAERLFKTKELGR